MVADASAIKLLPGSSDALFAAAQSSRRCRDMVGLPASSGEKPMTTSNVAAQVLVRAYLHGRSMDEFLFAAAVWMVDKRLAGAIMPALDQTLRDDIDSQAGEMVAFKQFWGTSPDSFAVPPPQRVIWT
jgi:hypothetical protein